MNKAALFLYRLVATISLYGVLVGVVAFSAVYFFYAVNSDWIVPIVISKEDPSVLEAEAKLVTTQQEIETLQLDIQKSHEGIAEMQLHEAALSKLYPQLTKATETESKASRKNGESLEALDERAKDVNSKAESALLQTRSVEHEIDSDLQAGLITKGEAVLQQSALAVQESSAVNDEMNETLLRDTILQKTTVGTELLGTLDKGVDLKSQIANLQLSVSAAQREIAAEQGQIRQLQDALQLLKDTPAFSVLMGARYFAFVPFENRNAAVGTDVYDCALSFINCRRVGTVDKVFSDEQRAENPIFKTQVRGFLVRLAQSDGEAAKSKTLFVRRPLWF